MARFASALRHCSNIKFTLLSYILCEGSHFKVLHKWCLKPSLKARGHISNCHTLGHRSVSWDCRKEHQGNQNSGWSLLHLAADMSILISAFCTRVHELKTLSSQWPRSCKVRGRAMRTETHLFSARKSRDSRQICIPIPTSMGEYYCFKDLPDWIIRDIVQCFSQCVLKQISQRFL